MRPAESLAIGSVAVFLLAGAAVAAAAPEPPGDPPPPDTATAELPHDLQPAIATFYASRSFRGNGRSVFRIRDRHVVSCEVSGDLAYVVNHYSYTWHRREDPPQWHRTKNVHIWRRIATGEWRLALDIWNSDVGIDEFPRE